MHTMITVRSLGPRPKNPTARDETGSALGRISRRRTRATGERNAQGLTGVFPVCLEFAYTCLHETRARLFCVHPGREGPFVDRRAICEKFVNGFFPPTRRHYDVCYPRRRAVRPNEWKRARQHKRPNNSRKVSTFNDRYYLGCFIRFEIIRRS